MNGVGGRWREVKYKSIFGARWRNGGETLDGVNNNRGSQPAAVCLTDGRREEGRERVRQWTTGGDKVDKKRSAHPKPSQTSLSFSLSFFITHPSSLPSSLFQLCSLHTSFPHAPPLPHLSLAPSHSFYLPSYPLFLSNSDDIIRVTSGWAWEFNFLSGVGNSIDLHYGNWRIQHLEKLAHRSKSQDIKYCDPHE